MALITNTFNTFAEVHLQFLTFVGIIDQKIFSIAVGRMSLLQFSIFDKIEAHIVVLTFATVFVYLVGAFGDDELKLLLTL